MRRIEECFASFEQYGYGKIPARYTLQREYFEEDVSVVC